MSGPAPKPANKRQNRITKSVGTIVALPPKNFPDAPPGLLVSTQKKWDAYFRSEVASMFTPSDLVSLSRLFELYDERQRCLNSARRKGRIVEGSTGQPVLNPLYKHMGELDREIRAMEDRFGLSPMARLKLGATFGEASKSLSDLFEVDDDDDDPRGEFIDAVATVVVPTDDKSANGRRKSRQVDRT